MTYLFIYNQTNLNYYNWMSKSVIVQKCHNCLKVSFVKIASSQIWRDTSHASPSEQTRHLHRQDSDLRFQKKITMIAILSEEKNRKDTIFGKRRLNVSFRHFLWTQNEKIEYLYWQQLNPSEFLPYCFNSYLNVFDGKFVAWILRAQEQWARQKKWRGVQMAKISENTFLKMARGFPYGHPNEKYVKRWQLVWAIDPLTKIMTYLIYGEVIRKNPQNWLFFHVQMCRNCLKRSVLVQKCRSNKYKKIYQLYKSRKNQPQTSTFMENQESEISLPGNNHKHFEQRGSTREKFPVSLNLNLAGEKNSQVNKNEKEGFAKKKNFQKCQKYRKKKSGKYEPTILERAKEILKNNLYEIAELTRYGIWGQLSSEEQKLIKKFIVNIRQREKKPPSENPKALQAKLNITEEQQNTISNIQVCRNELISKELCACQNIENQIAVMAGWNRKNHPAIFEFLKSLQQVPFENFFEALIEVIQATENLTQQVRLLIGLFGIYNGQKLNPGPDLCGLALTYLAKEDGVTSQQVIGFLKFAFITNGDLHKAELSDLDEFDKRHKQCFVGFKQWLQWTFHLPPDLTFVLPNSCYILGLPFAKRLQRGGAALTEHIPSDFLGLFIETLVFSFEQEEEPFVDFLNVAKKSFLDFMEKIKTTQLLNLFSGLLHQVRSHDRQWYLNIRNTKRLIEGAFTLAKENKVRLFDNEVCKNLLSDVTNIEQYLAVPSLLKGYTNQGNDELFRAFLQLNAKNRGCQKFLDGFDFGQSLPWRVMSTFETLKITPHFIQELAMKIISQNTCTHSFLNIAPGLGKTKLIVAAAVDLVQSTDFPVFVLNSSKTLCDRDFQEATIPLEELKILCASVISQRAKITFSTTKDFIDQKDNLPENHHVLLDEYQNIFFDEELFLDFVEIVKFSKSFIGFSGSPLNPVQEKLLQNSFDKQTLVLQLTPRTDLAEQETTICKTQTLLVRKLAGIANEYRYDTPQVFILDLQTATALVKGRKSQRYEYLIDKEPAVVNNMLADLFNKPNDKGEYGTYIINEEMGTGTDFKTSSDIESKGGLVLVFGIKPTNTSTFEQLSCRVGRIFNKSRRFYIIQDTTYTGSNRDYLKYQLKIVRQKEYEEARALLSKLRPDINNASIIENEDDVDELAGSMVVDESSEDIEVENGRPNQNDHNQITSNDKSHLTNEKQRSMYEESDESFDGKGLEMKGKRSQKIKQDQIQSGDSKKRTRKEQAKLSLQQKRLQQQHKEEIKEGKVWEEASIEPHDCQVKENALNTQVNMTLDLNGVGLDPSSFLKCQSDFNPDQISAEQSEIGNRKNSEVGFQHILISENFEKFTPKVGVQLQKRRRDTKNANLLEQNVKKSLLQTQEKEDEGSKQTQEKEGGEGSKEKEDKKKEHIIIQKKETIRCSSRKPLNVVDQAYFSNYGHKEIHEEMLTDKVRCETYKDAIVASVKGKIVLDVGAGTGFLSVIAAKAGASHVYAVEYSEMVDYAKQFINDNGCTANITLIKRRMEDVSTLDVPKVDVIISEWMGYFLLFENMLPSVIDARRRFLKEDGLMLPCEGRINIAAVEWIGTEMNGVIMKPDKKSFNEAQVMLCSQDRVISSQCTISDFDLQESGNPLDNFGSQPFSFQLTRDATVNAFVGWFAVALTKEINLSTAPSQPDTHWKQVMFFLNKEIQAKAGDVIEGVFKMKAGSHNHRSLSINLSYKLSTSKSVLKQSFVLEQ